MYKITFALFFGNRGFMPEKLVDSARKDMIEAVEKAGHDYIMMDENLTKHGAVETRGEGRTYAKWLKENEGKFQGVILCMPNFSDENGAIAALEEANVPILIQAYPDDLELMDFDNRRDAYCGKFSIQDVFNQYKVAYTVFEPHVVYPNTDKFQENLQEFAAVCRVVNGMRKFTIGCLGARTTAFKTVRFDEITLQKYGITVETFDMSEVFAKVKKLSETDERVLAKKEMFVNYSDFSNVPEKKLINISKLAVIIDEYMETYKLDAVTIRCWSEMQTELGITPCVILSEMNNRGVVASCELDLCSAISMYAMQLASEEPTTCLDWNNNYGDDEEKVVLFHCGPVPQKLMTDKGIITDHKMIAKNNPGTGWGTNEGRIREFDMTFSNCKTEDGKLVFYVEEGKFTRDEIPHEYFGCAGVAKISNLESRLMTLGKQGFRHHTSVGMGHTKKVIKEAIETYLEYDFMDI